jgi:hypothetical protein
MPNGGPVTSMDGRAGVVGGLAVAAGAVVGALTFRKTRRRRREGQVAERFARAVEQLCQPGAERLQLRLRAVYALERIARDSAELHWPIMEVLTAHLREHAPARPGADAESRRTPADHHAIVAVLRRRSWWREAAHERLDLHGTNLPGADLNEANLGGADLGEANLRMANLGGADLRGANLGAAYLGWANLNEANLDEANLDEANLFGANLVGAHLVGAHLVGAHLGWADLRRADLRGAVGLTPLQLATAASTERAKLSLEPRHQDAPVTGEPASEPAREAAEGTDS